MGARQRCQGVHPDAEELCGGTVVYGCEAHQKCRTADDRFRLHNRLFFYAPHRIGCGLMILTVELQDLGRQDAEAHGRRRIHT